jgi:hypothetical protein
MTLVGITAADPTSTIFVRLTPVCSSGEPFEIRAVRVETEVNFVHS